MATTKRQSWADARSTFKRDQRRAIALAAIELLVEGGSAELTMSTIADRAEISRQTLYRYFPDLTSVLAASVEGIEDADAELRAWVLAAASPREQLHRCAEALMDAGAQHGANVGELVAALPPQARDALHDHERRTVGLLAEALGALGADGSCDYAGDPEIDAALVLGLIVAATDESRDRAIEWIDKLTS